MSGAVRSNQILETARRVHDEVIRYPGYPFFNFFMV